MAVAPHINAQQSNTLNSTSAYVPFVTHTHTQRMCYTYTLSLSPTAAYQNSLKSHHTTQFQKRTHLNWGYMIFAPLCCACHFNSLNLENCFVVFDWSNSRQTWRVSEVWVCVSIFYWHNYLFVDRWSFLSVKNTHTHSNFTHSSGLAAVASEIGRAHVWTPVTR